MNRRDFFGAIGAAIVAPALGRASESPVRYVMFNPPKSEMYAIYWMHGHRPIDEFVSMHGELLPACANMQHGQVKQGWASFKLGRIGIYLSDAPLANFEPITYWIPADARKEEAA